MKKDLFTTLFFSTLYFYSFGQKPTEKAESVKNISAISIGTHIPAGEFSKTHTIGASAAYNSIKHQYKNTLISKLSFTWNSGAAYYLGKKETGLNYTYKYPAYLFIHGNGGILFSPVKNGFATLTAGPAIGFYNGSTEFNFNIQFDVNYYINKTILVSHVIILMKEPGARSLWSPGLKAMFIL